MLPDLAVLAVIYLLVLRPRWREAGRRTLAVRSVFCLYIVCVLGVTLLPVLSNLPGLAGNRYVPMELEPFRDLRNGYGNAARQLALNVVMTVPRGVFVAAGAWKEGRVAGGAGGIFAEPVYRAFAAAADHEPHVGHHRRHRQHSRRSGGLSAVSARWQTAAAPLPGKERAVGGGVTPPGGSVA